MWSGFKEYANGHEIVINLSEQNRIERELFSDLYFSPDLDLDQHIENKPLGEEDFSATMRRLENFPQIAQECSKILKEQQINEANRKVC